ncbi:MAG: hypothetical protein JO091_13300 [Acidobacteriaceae bacterium]|nr:hypothetical protein [Acidobacteriaceae bacterium]
MASSAPPQNVTQLLAAWSNGDDAALAALVPITYDELRRLAKFHTGRERAEHTPRTAHREWNRARAWLYSQLSNAKAAP